MTLSPSMVKRGGGVVDIRPRVVKWDRSKYCDPADKDEFIAQYSKIDGDELVTKYDKSRIYPAGYVSSGQLGIDPNQLTSCVHTAVLTPLPTLHLTRTRHKTC